jgi:processive 1,2-diacylglycerol beta-glucosyltransferase
MVRRVLLLYSPDHSGHKMAATALEEAFRIGYPRVKVRGMNLIKYTNPLLGAAATVTYRGLIQNNPAVWRHFYDNEVFKEKTERLRDAVYLSSYVRFRKIMEDHEPDVVICTQAFPCIIVDKFKKITGKRLPLVGVVTDFFANLYWMLPGVDLFCVAAEESKRDFVQMGGAGEKIEVTGIPIRPRFTEPVNREKVRERNRQRTILVMGGVRGLGPISTVVETLCSLGSDVHVVSIAGRNKRLLRKLEGVKRRYPDRVEVLTYVENVHELMARSDLLISKAGGITTSECLASGLPMVLVSPIPGHEARNARLLADKGAAVLANSAEAAARLASDLLGNEERLNIMKRSMSGLSCPDSSFRIVDKVVAAWGG